MLKPSVPAAHHAWWPQFTPWGVAALSLVLSGLGCLWLADWGAYGPAFARDMAQQQLWALLIGVLLACGLLCIRQPLAWRGLWFSARWGTWPLSLQRLCLFSGATLVLCGVTLLHWGHKFHQLPGLPSGAQGFARAVSLFLRDMGWQPVTPSVTAELLRWPACLLLAWLLYRAIHARLNAATQILWALSVLVVMLLGLWFSRDKGPILVVALAWVCLWVAVLRMWLASRLGKGMVVLLSLVVLITAVAGLALALPLVAPADRVAAWRQPFNAPLEYLAEVHWILQAVGWSGGGSGQTPWCGYLGAVLNNCQSMSVATQSDLTIAALAALWGAPVAWLIAAAVAACLVGLIRMAGAPRPTTGGIDAFGLAASVGALYALLMLAQWAVTVSANLGLTPLAGVSLPYLSWGRTGLLSLALATALVWPPAGRPSGHVVQAELWLHLAWVGAALSGIVLVAAVYGFTQIFTAAAPTHAQSGRANPWLPLAACVQTTGGQALAGAGGPCEPGQRAIALPADATLRAAITQLARQQPMAEPWLKDRLQIPRRAGVHLTIDGSWQAKSDALAACLTNAATSESGSCEQIPTNLKEDFAKRYEGAAARSVSWVTIRVRDGAILAAADGRSPCSVQQMAGLDADADCPDTAARKLPRPGRLSHQALHAHEMISSTIKPLEAAALLASSTRWTSAPDQEKLHSALVRSDTAFFIDHLLCTGAKSFASCKGLEQLRYDIQAWELARPMPLWEAAGHYSTMTVPGLPVAVPAWPPKGSAALLEKERKAALACSQRPAARRWRGGCGGEHLAATLAPLWGQGEARAHPLAVASLYLRLTSAAQGARQAPAPHLWSGHAPPAVAAGFVPAHAKLILSALRDVPLKGTAASACRSVFGPQGCAGREWAMKTGTSLFPHDALSASERAAHCTAIHAQGGPRRDEVACALYPMKWVVLIEDLAQPEARITVALAERNWSRASGRIDASGDIGPNVAAQAAILLHAR